MIKVFVLVVIIASVSGQQSLLNRLKIVDPIPYFINVVQETVYELEKKGFCNLKLDDFNQTLNEITHTNMLVTGGVNYSNGFLVSIEKIDVSAITGLINTRTVDNVIVTTATVRGFVNLRDAKVGYDVATNITTLEKQRRYTGIIKHTLIKGRFDIMMNLNTREVSTFTLLNEVSEGSGVRMVYSPPDEISEILSLRFQASSTFDNARRWFEEDISQILLKIATNKVQFPDVCFNC